MLRPVPYTLPHSPGRRAQRYSRIFTIMVGSRKKVNLALRAAASKQKGKQFGAVWPERWLQVRFLQIRTAVNICPNCLCPMFLDRKSSNVRGCGGQIQKCPRSGSRTGIHRRRRAICANSGSIHKVPRSFSESSCSLGLKNASSDRPDRRAEIASTGRNDRGSD